MPSTLSDISTTYGTTSSSYKFFSNAPQNTDPVSTWAPTWFTNYGYVFIIVESYYYGMIPYSCYTANSYPESIITVTLNGGATI